MAYEPQTWVDGEEGGTPLSAARLNHLEQGVADHQHAASEITGTLAAGRIPNLSQSKITGLADALGDKANASALSALEDRVAALEATAGDPA